MDTTLLVVYVMNGTFFHFQTMAAWVLMGYVSPVTHRFVSQVLQAFARELLFEYAKNFRETNTRVSKNLSSVVALSTWSNELF